MATACAVLLAEHAGQAVTIWARSAERAEELARDRENHRLLPGVPIPPAIEVTHEIASAGASAELFVAAIPTKYLRETGGKEYFESLMKGFSDNVGAHIAVYGPDNHLRLTGLHETQAIDKFSYGLSDRGASVRMPVNFIKNGYKGYLEDRRPNSEGDPYQIVSQILHTINSVPKP